MVPIVSVGRLRYRGAKPFERSRAVAATRVKKRMDYEKAECEFLKNAAEKPLMNANGR